MKSRFAKQLDGVSFLVVGHGALARRPCPTTLWRKTVGLQLVHKCNLFKTLFSFAVLRNHYLPTDETLGIAVC
jgi:hypothetical protein